MEKITYSINHSPSLFDAPGTDALALRKILERIILRQEHYEKPVIRVLWLRLIFNSHDAISTVARWLTAEKIQPTICRVVVGLIGRRVRRDSHVGKERKTSLRGGVPAERVGLRWIIATSVVCCLLYTSPSPRDS